MRALIVSYAFPPVGGAGVQRVLKLVKYLPSHGVTPAVLTARDASVPLTDASLEAELPGDVEVIRARTFEPGYAAKQAAWKASASAKKSVAARWTSEIVRLGRGLMLPDPQVLWLPAAELALAERLASAKPDDVVFISGPPFSQFLLGPLARLRRQTALVLDYRDEWTTTGSLFEMSGSARAGAVLEKAVLRSAHAVTTATEEFRTALLSRFSFLDPARVVTIPNGYDPADFPEGLPGPPSDHFVLCYAGTVFKLTSARSFLEALRRLHVREPQLAKLLEVRFLGRIVETELDAFEGSETLGVKRLGYIDHVRALEQLSASHATLCILDDVAGAERIYPAKIFELMRLGKPCLAITPEGALANLVRKHQAGDVASPREPDAIAAVLERMLREFRDGVPPQSAAVDIERYDRRLQAGEFARVFRMALGAARKREVHSESGVTLGDR
jgi:glycosyltransferase involved in cell wall biosynthesis